MVDQMVGEYIIQLLLTSNLSRQEASPMAAAWTGDQLSAYLEGEHLLTAWITAWKKDEDAEPSTARTKTCWRGVTACVSPHHLVGPTVYKPSYPETA